RMNRFALGIPTLTLCACLVGAATPARAQSVSSAVTRPDDTPTSSDKVDSPQARPRVPTQQEIDEKRQAQKGAIFVEGLWADTESQSATGAKVSGSKPIGSKGKTGKSIGLFGSGADAGGGAFSNFSKSIVGEFAFAHSFANIFEFLGGLRMVNTQNEKMSFYFEGLA